MTDHRDCSNLAPSTHLMGALQARRTARRRRTDVPEASASEVCSWLEFSPGNGNCNWAKVNLSGWKSLGYEEEKGT